MRHVVPRSRLLRLGAAFALIAGLLSPAAQSAVASASSSTNASLKHVFVIMLENHSQSSVLGDANAPFINALARQYAVAADYYGVTHPSEPNYVAAISGSNWFVNDDSPANRYDHTNLVDQLEAAHKTWAAYMEAMPSTGFLGDSANGGLYQSKHNPFVLFTDIRDNPARLANIKPYSQFASDLASNHVADFVWITPDQCNDMHGGIYSGVTGYPEAPCPYGKTNDDPNDAALKQKADAFVKTTVEAIMHSSAWTGNSAIFILTDENDYTGNAATDGWASAAGCCDSPILPPGYRFLGSNGVPDGNTWAGGMYGGGLIPAIVVTTHGRRAYTDTTPYNHYSMLKTIEQAWNLGYLGAASDGAQVTSMLPLIAP